MLPTSLAGAIYALYSSVSIDGTTSYHYNNGDGMGGKDPSEDCFT